MKFGKVSKTKDLNEYDDVRIVGKTFPHHEAIRLMDSPQTRMKPGFVRNQVYYSYNNFTTNENPWMKRHGTAGTLAVPFCYYDMELNKQ